MKQRVIVVEDDPVLLQLYTQIVEFAGYEVTGFKDGRPALEAIETNPPDLLTLDVNLPGIPGIDLLRHARERLQLTDLKIVIVTANIVSARSETAKLADKVLEKPVSNEVFRQTLEQLLGKTSTPT